MHPDTSGCGIWLYGAGPAIRNQVFREILRRHTPFANLFRSMVCCPGVLTGVLGGVLLAWGCCMAGGGETETREGAQRKRDGGPSGRPTTPIPGCGDVEQEPGCDLVRRAVAKSVDGATALQMPGLGAEKLTGRSLARRGLSLARWPHQPSNRAEVSPSSDCCTGRLGSTRSSTHSSTCSSTCQAYRRTGQGACGGRIAQLICSSVACKSLCPAGLGAWAIDRWPCGLDFSRPPPSPPCHHPMAAAPCMHARCTRWQHPADGRPACGRGTAYGVAPHSVGTARLHAAPRNTASPGLEDQVSRRQWWPASPSTDT
ncbi:hypothetical protein F4802DRAFT_520966 [Xylaria palmicola]|nr:hypothetical protein F4802DRAFT_520966 [Xylaria palmicola]